jgi:hypothetical protein
MMHQFYFWAITIRGFSVNCLELVSIVLEFSGLNLVGIVICQIRSELICLSNWKVLRNQL